MGKTSRDKGKRGELELAHELTRLGIECRRGQQYCGASGDADVVGVPGVHIECKRTETLRLNEAMAQARRDARDGEVPVVIHRRNRGPWIVVMDLGDWVGMYVKDERSKA